MRASVSQQARLQKLSRLTSRTDFGSSWRRERRKLEVMEGVAGGVAGRVEHHKEQEYTVRRYRAKHILLLLLILVQLFSNTSGRAGSDVSIHSRLHSRVIEAV